MRLKIRLVVVAMMAASVPWTVASADSAWAAERCVGSGAGCFPGLQSALDAAHDGDTIRMEPGTFAGGVTITRSVAVVGAGRSETFLNGGGPVLTIGAFGAEHEPTVSIRDLTITGGRTTSSSVSVPFTGQEGVIASGGGIDIPPGGPVTQDRLGPGATVTLTRTTVSNNRAAPSSTAPFGPPCPDGEPCPFAMAAGGGISSAGTLTVVDSTIAGNRVGSASGLSTLASDADGGAIYSLGSVTVIRSRIANNRVSATGPVGRFSEGGAMFLLGPEFTMRNSVVSGNSSYLASELPNSVDQLANAGGIHITTQVRAAEIDRSVFRGNSVRATNTVGGAVAFSGGVHVDSPVAFRMTDSLIAENRASAATLGSSAGLAHADSGGGQLFGEMTRTRIRGNVVRAVAAGGDAEAFAGGLWVLFGHVSDSALLANRLDATSGNGAATVRAAGALVDLADGGQGGLTLTRSIVDGNMARASGTTTLGQGGGLFDAFVGESGPFGGPLTLSDSTIAHNVLSGPSDASLQGGGLYLAGQPLTLTNSVIADNVPNQCFGCTGGSPHAARRPATARLTTRPGDQELARIFRREAAGGR